MVDTSNNPRMRYLINDACVLAEREPKMTTMTNSVSGGEGVTIPLVSGSVICTREQLKVYSHQVGGWGDTDAYTPSSNL